MVLYVFLVLKKLGWEDCCEFKASLGSMVNLGQDYTVKACLKETKALINHKNTEELITLDFSFVLKRAEENLLRILQGKTDCGVDREWSSHNLDVLRNILSHP